MSATSVEAKDVVPECFFLKKREMKKTLNRLRKNIDIKMVRKKNRITDDRPREKKGKDDCQVQNYTKMGYEYNDSFR